MERIHKIITLWLMIMCGFASHSLTDFLPMCWGKDVRIATDGVVDQSMIMCIVILSFLIPVIGLFCMLTDVKSKAVTMCNAVLACLIALFNVAHACMELPSDNAGQYVIMPMMIIIGAALAWHSVKYLKEN